MNSSWTRREFVNDFIVIYKSNPCLWNLQCVDYMNRIKRDAAYNQLLELCKKTDPTVGVELVKSKINSIRTSYRKELTKIGNSIKRGEDIYVPKLWYFNLLEFLSEQDTHSILQPYHSLNFDEFTETNEHFQETSVLEEKEDQTESDNEPIANMKPQSRKRTVVDNDENLMTHEGNFQNRPDLFSNSDREPDEFDALGVSVSKKLRKMNRLQQLFAENLINKALFLGSMGQLNINSDVQPISSYSNYHSPSASSTYTSN